MGEFETYLRLGYGHIIDLGAHDHLLFVVALCAVYRFEQWRNILVLVTAFTIGHSLTLALATNGVFFLSPELIEFLIPITILITALLNVFENVETANKRTMRWNYALALFFGLIHGMGFSNFLRAVLGAEESIVLPLFAFNVGLEAGQLFVLFFVLLLALVMVRIVRMRRYDWVLVLSGATAGIALMMMVERAVG